MDCSEFYDNLKSDLDLFSLVPHDDGCLYNISNSGSGCKRTAPTEMSLSETSSEESFPSSKIARLESSDFKCFTISRTPPLETSNDECFSSSKTSPSETIGDECFSSSRITQSETSNDESFFNQKILQPETYNEESFFKLPQIETSNDESFFNTKISQAETSNDDYCSNSMSSLSKCSNDLSYRNAPASDFYLCNIRPLKVECLQSMRDLNVTCEKLGLKFCPSDLTLNTDALKYDYFIRKCSVQGLYPYETLNQMCKKLQLKIYNNNVKSILRKVDIILEHKYQKGTLFYFVKWKRLSTKRNSWVSKDSLLPTYRNAVIYYNAICHLYSEINQEMIHYFFQDLVNRKPYDYLTLVKVCALLVNESESFVNQLSLSFTELKNKAKAILNIPARKLKQIQSEFLQIMQFSQQRKSVLINLNEWEKDINNFNPAAYIEVENNVDLEMAPTNFQFIHDYVRNQDFAEEPVCFCRCDNCYENKKACCPHDSDGAFPYNKYGRLQLLPGYPIYECNKLCECGSDCVNRVVQHGQKVKVAIFRTSNGCGWGLKTLEVIQKDQFVLEYLGEIITSEEAEARGETYDFIGRTYLFDLDYGEGNCLYTVDAGHMGNAGHFINHSCDPNLHVFALWINQPDPNLPRLALFANRKINRGEELTFDYKMVKNRDGFGVASSPPVGVECKCNAKNCRNYLF